MNTKVNFSKSLLDIDGTDTGEKLSRLLSNIIVTSSSDSENEIMKFYDYAGELMRKEIGRASCRERV